jgi:hypothetical protein
MIEIYSSYISNFYQNEGSPPSGVGDRSLFWLCCFRPFGCIAPKHFSIIWLSNLSILSVPDEDYPRNVHNVFILLFFYVIIWLGKIYTVVVTVWLTVKKYLYLKLQRLFYFLRITDKTFYWTWLYIWIPRRVSYKKQELLTFREHLSSPPGFFGGVRVADLFSLFVLSYYVSLCSEFRVVMSVAFSA